MEKEYGLKAPTLPDGTTLLKEVPLSEEHTSQMKSDKTAMQQAMNRSAVTFIILIAVCFLMNFMGILLLVTSVVNESYRSPEVYLAAGVLMLSSWGLEKHAKKGGLRLSLQMLNISKASKAAAELFPLYARYMPGEPGMQHYTYMRLLMDNDSELGTSEQYRLRLDTSNANGYVVREVLVPKAV